MNSGSGFMSTVRWLLNIPPPEGPLMSEADMVMRSWATAIKTRDGIPEAFREAFDALPAAPDRFPYTVFVPSQGSYDNGSAGRLIVGLDGRIAVIEESGGAMTTTYYPVGDVSCVEMGIVLLYAWISIRGLGDGGETTFTEVRFNTVNDYLFTPFVKQIRAATETPERTSLPQEWRKFDPIGKQNLKMRNFAQRSLAAGECVVRHIFQPEIRISVLRSLGRRLLRTHFPAHVTILTNRELILIQDGAVKRFGRGIRHGGTWDYIPLGHIASIALEGGPDDLLTLSVELSTGDRIERLFRPAQRADLDALLAACTAAPK